MIPLRDSVPTRRLPVVTLAIIGACVAVFLYELVLEGSGESALERFILEYGVTPARLGAAFASGAVVSAATATLVTSLFLHAGWLHLLGNMLYLWIFGNNVEDRLGRAGFLLFYLAGGILAGLTQFAIAPNSPVPLVGASGAIAATLGTYVVLYPAARIETLVFLGFFYQVIAVRAVIVLGFWFLLQLVQGATSLGDAAASGGVALFAHIGGFVMGLAVGVLIRGRPVQRRGPWPDTVG